MSISKRHVLQGIKLALAAVTAITLAKALGLKYSTTAGTITMLSILDTKRETLRVALNRLLAYLAALGISWISYHLLGYTTAGFGLFLMVFATLCCVKRWMFALTMVTVLVGHFLSEGGMTAVTLRNETLLFMIGVLCGIAVNLTLRVDETKMREMIAGVDGEMKQLLAAAADPLRRDDAQQQLARLDDALSQARKQAAANSANRLRNAPVFDLAYVDMRARQRDILAQILAASEKVGHIPAQHQAVTAFFQRVAEEYHMGNDVSELRAGLKELLETMKADSLPVTREEFESRAVLYYMLVRLMDFLDVKGSFYQAYQQEMN